jgi:hypothetical protein
MYRILWCITTLVMTCLAYLSVIAMGIFPWCSLGALADVVKIWAQMSRRPTTAEALYRQVLSIASPRRY